MVEEPEEEVGEEEGKEPVEEPAAEKVTAAEEEEGPEIPFFVTIALIIINNIINNK